MRFDTPYSVLYVILTKPNDGNIVIISLVKPIKSIQNYGIYTPKDDGGLFRVNLTPNYPDAMLEDHTGIVKYVNAHLDMRDYDCPLDIVRRIVQGAFKAGLSSNKVLNELLIQYPDLKT